jgi:hypothetical protein
VLDAKFRTCPRSTLYVQFLWGFFFLFVLFLLVVVLNIKLKKK